MALLQHLIAILWVRWVFLSAVDGLVVPITTGNNATNSTMHHENNAMSMPGEVVLTLTTENETITLNLTRNLNIPSDVPVVVAGNGTQTTWKSNSDQFAVYYEMNSSASIAIEMKNQNGEIIKRCRGTLSINGIYYSVQPLEDNFGNHSSEEIFVDIDGVDHVMKVEDAEMDFADLMNSNASQSKYEKQVNATEDDMFDWPSGTQNYVVEMGIFVDYSIYNRWYSRSQARDHSERDNDAIRNIYYYFVQVANGVDMRYATITGSDDFTIRVRLVGIRVASSASESVWTERSEFTDSDGYSIYTDMYKAKEYFENWLPTRLSTLGFTFDQATVFTGKKLYDGNRCNGVPCSASGVGGIGTICELSAPRANSVTLNRDFGIYASIQTAAHELGHNLGSNHDGQSFQCSSSDQYIMATSPGELTASNFNNPFKFSSCSQWHFRNTLAKITMTGKGNCLLVGSPSPTFTGPPNFAINPGQQYSADQQCQDMYGPSSFYCAGGGSRDQTICQSMECWLPEKGACVTKAEQRAADGTKCGNNKWCMKGQCVYDPRSPATSDTCIYGDYKDRVYVFSGIKMLCRDMGRLEPHSCYLNRTAGDCCQTCATFIRENKKPTGCAYGDKDPNHCRSYAKKSNCYEASYADTCCDSCNSLKSSSLGCEYGDKGDCNRNGAYNCYQSGKDCCETCQKFYDSRYPGCEYGDRAPWCLNHVKGPEQCLGASDTELCCRSCAPYTKNRNQVCSDQASWCSTVSARDCYDYPTAKTCCSTCSRYIRGY